MSTGPNRAISLMRSATMPMVPGLKREASEAPSLSSIPTSDSQPFAANRGGVLNSKRFAQREVDLSNIAPESNVKARKQAKIEAELKEAIAALKKPNRELAGKVLVETAERRSVSATHPRSELSYLNLAILVLTFCRVEETREKSIIPGGSNLSNP
jgi:DNA replication regulator SLD3